jgi:hypothetical protein
MLSLLRVLPSLAALCHVIWHSRSCMLHPSTQRRHKPRAHYAPPTPSTRRLDSQQDEDFKNPASVLFNSFIFAQLGNLLNARRINNEYNIFAGLSFTKSPVFLAILFIIVALQVRCWCGCWAVQCVDMEVAGVDSHVHVWVILVGGGH